MNPFKRTSEHPACPSCGNGVEPAQLSCLACGTMLGRRGTVSGAAWGLPVAAVAAVVLALSTGIAYASGAALQDGDVTVAEAPPGQGAAPGEGEPGGPGGDGGSDDLAQLDPPAPGDGDGSDLDDGGPGDGDGDDDDGDDKDKDDDDKDRDDDGGDDGGGNGGGGNRGGAEGGGGSTSPREPPELVGPEQSRDLADFPRGGSGYTVALKVTSSRSAALREARAAANEADGIPAGVISRSDFPDLPGAYVTFAGGPFDSRADAERARDEYATLGFNGDVIQVGSGG